MKIVTIRFGQMATRISGVALVVNEVFSPAPDPFWIMAGGALMLLPGMIPIDFPILVSDREKLAGLDKELNKVYIDNNIYKHDVPTDWNRFEKEIEAVLNPAVSDSPFAKFKTESLLK